MPSRRPQLKLIASSEEAAAIAASIESFLHDTSPPVREPTEGPAGWARAAMLEGVMREEHGDVPHPWINP
ncbi:MAG: hypothetical protein WB709_09210 [Solirubrobacteraceae bacterium]